MNVWISGPPNHQWNPGQARPKTAGEAEIDRLMRLQAGTVVQSRRKPLFDRVQQLVSDEAPFLYLVNKNALMAVARSVRNVSPSVLRPQVIWNADRLWIGKAN